MRAWRLLIGGSILRLILLRILGLELMREGSVLVGGKCGKTIYRLSLTGLVLLEIS